MRVLVFGETGQVARSLADLGAADPSLDIRTLSRVEADLTDPDSLRDAVYDAAETWAPDAVVNAAAYTAVDKAEEEPALANAANAHAPGVIARACAGRDIPFVHLSTDFVFAGDASAPYKETDRAAPLGVYGASKLAGEGEVREAGGVAAVVRTSWVFSAYGRNFVKTMLRLGAERDHLRVVDDQIGCPTPAEDVARAALAAARGLIDKGAAAGGVYHYAGAEPTTWARLAEAALAEAGLKTPVERITTADFPTPAARPAYSVLECAKVEAAFGLPPADWRAGLARVIAALKDDALETDR